MSGSTTDMFDAPDAGEPATTGSYGEAPRGYRLPEATRLGPVRLQVSELARSLRFYEQTLGMRRLGGDETRAELGAHGDDTPLVELLARADVRPTSPRSRLGLFHFAILLPDRAALGRFLRHLSDLGVHTGASDHVVSEALYLSDPDELGIEVYADRPRATWRRRGRELMLATDPLDVAGLLNAAGSEPWTGMPAGTAIGHVHLHVGDLATASAFFADALGLDRMTWSYPGALFLGAGGYHHHLGTNTWAGSGARSPADDDARLLEWTIELPHAADVVAVARSLAAGGYAADVQADGCLVTRDPWGTAIRVRAAG